MDNIQYFLNHKIVAILSILFSIAAIVIAFRNPIQGYELSIYDSTPFIVWFCLVLSIIGAFFIVFYQISANKYMSSNFWMIGIFILLLNRLILLYIPYIRGYFSWRGDNISHVGALKDIIVSGHIPFSNVYPITHIFLSIIYEITGISQNIIINYSTSIFSIFYVISIFILSIVTLHKKKEQILAVTSIAVVFFSYNVFLMPNGWSQLYLPLLVFFYFRSLEKHNSSQYKLLFVILLIMYPFFHPLSSLYAIFILIFISATVFLTYLFIPEEKDDEKLANQIKRYTFKWQLLSGFIKHLKTKISNVPTLKGNYKYHFPLTAILIETTILIPWVLSFQSFQLNLRLFYKSILTGTSPDVIEGMQNTLSKIDISGMEFVQLLIKSEGANLIFIGLFAISLFVSNKKSYGMKNGRNLLILSGITILTGFIYAIYLFGIVPGLHAIAAQRFKSYITLFTPISAGLVFASFFQKKLTVKTINLFPILCMFIILTASILSICSMYPSPNVIEPTPSITQMDMQATEWFVYHHNEAILTTYVSSPIYRFIDGVIGPTKREIILGPIYKHKAVPDHFNYSNVNKLGELYLEDRYMMITMFDTVIYDTVWSAVDRFDLQDFNQLSEDTSIDKLYSNGEAKIFFVHSVI